MFESLDQVNGYLDALFAYGPVWIYLAILVACFIENVIPPFPGDSFILAGGVLVGLGRLELGWVLAMANLGGMSSVLVLYFLGRRFGHAYFMSRNFRYFSADDVVRMERRLDQHGPWIMMASRFLFGIRSVLAIAAGIGRYSVVRTAGYSLISYLAFSGLLVYVAMKLVEHFGVIRGYFAAYSTVIWALVILIVGIWMVRRFLILRRSRLEQRKGI